MNKEIIKESALSIRLLTIDAIQKAKSGHPGLPMGCAELGSLIFSEILKHCPGVPDWINRDRFVLSAGHGSMLLYSLLFLSGYEITIEDIKNFRQLGSKTQGHPEYWSIPGIETTTGPLGQGFANSIGFAIAETMLASIFNTAKHKIIDHYTYVLAGDGDLMEGITSEAASLAGHLGLGKLIVFYDYNEITIDGKTSLTFSEDVIKRFEAYKWHTLTGDAYDLDQIMSLLEIAKENKEKPSLILLKSIIGKGSPNLQNSHKVHGAPLGDGEIKKIKKKYGIDEDTDFYYSDKVINHFKNKMDANKKIYEKWVKKFDVWKDENPGLYEKWENYFNNNYDFSDIDFKQYNIGEKISTRAVGAFTLDALKSKFKKLIGGTADLTGPCLPKIKNFENYNKNNRSGSLISYGIREHAMGAISNGLALYGGLRVFCATFMVFSDYLRPSLRLSAMMKLPVIYILTHDSILIGEDGPTHQPIEHLASLRAIPNVLVLRPGDAKETEVAWKMAIENTNGPTVIALTRQDLEVYKKDVENWESDAKKGAYIVKDCEGFPELIIIATGSEVKVAIDTSNRYKNKNIRVVSMISRELFLSQSEDFKNRILENNSKKVIIEAGISQGWYVFFANNPIIHSIESFGISGPCEDVAKYFGFTEEKFSEIIESELAIR